MAVTSGAIVGIETIKGDILADGLQHAAVLFTMSGTYAQADNSTVAAVGAAISASRRNGKTVTLKDVMLWQAARKLSDPGILLGAKTLAVSTDAITFELTLGSTDNVLDISTEFTDATAIPTQSTPFGVLVSFVES